MAVTGKTIPSVNVPFTDRQGRISPIWHEFLRSFVAASVDGTIGGDDVVTSVVAGNGLVGTTTGNTTTLRVGQGQAIAVNADDVNVNISDLAHILPSLDDEILVSDVTDNNTIRKTQVRNIVGLSAPGGTDGQVQFNDNDVFTGDSAFTYNGSGSLTLGTLTVNGATFDTATNADKFIFRVPVGSSAPHFTFTQSGVGSSGMPFNIESTLAGVELNLENNADGGGSTTPESVIRFLSEGTVSWCVGLNSESAGRAFTLGTTGLNVGNVFTVDATNRYFTMGSNIMKATTAGITASTTQTQGQSALTADVNEISVCANANDVVTLPAAIAGRSCLVINNGAQTLQVFPASGDDLGAGVNTSTTIVATSRKLFVAYDGTNWEPVV